MPPGRRPTVYHAILALRLNATPGAVQAAQAVAPGCALGRWREMEGGRTNRVWRVRRRSGSTVTVKEYARAATPLFRNDPRAELAALRHLRGTGLAPHPLGLSDRGGLPVLVYEHVESHGPAEPEDTARALARLHATPPPRTLRPMPDLGALLANMLPTLWDPPEVLRVPRPPPAAEPPGAFVHGDPTPGNALATPGGCVLIDWQCPAVGDPCWDLGMLVSPAMRRLDGLPPLSRDRTTAVLDAYGSPETVGRLAGLLPTIRALLAAHCLWRAQRGWPGAAEAAAAEIAAMG